MTRALASLLGALWWWCLPVRRKLAVQNHQRCFPDRDPAELRRTVGEVCVGYLELALGCTAFFDRTDLVPRDGAIGLAGHGASWDLALVAFSHHFPVTIFVKPPSGRLARWLIGRLRARGGDLELLPPSGSMQAAYAALAAGRVVVFVQDQRYNQGISSPFFGRPALTSAAFATMVLKTGKPVIGFWPGRTRDLQHEVCIQRLREPAPPNDSPSPQEVQALTDFSQTFYERQIRRTPHAWWWLHDRWRAGGRSPLP